MRDLKQPRKHVLREQLALAATTIIEEREESLANVHDLLEQLGPRRPITSESGAILRWHLANPIVLSEPRSGWWTVAAVVAAFALGLVVSHV